MLLYRTREIDPLNLLTRWFVIGEPVPENTAKQAIPPDILRLLAQTGLLALAGNDLAGTVMFTPFEQFWIATDTYARLAAGTGEDDVLMINSTTLFLMNLSIRTPCRSLLDLGTGCGVVAIVSATHYAEQVTATDLTSRAAAFARFNSWLNETGNVEVLTGDLFQPVAGRKFARILSNPPFYVTPTSRRVFAENPFELDGFCRNLVKQAPACLEEGGFLQMLCEWPEIEGQPWEERLAEWFEGSGCDAVVFEGGNYDPVRYAQARLPVVTAPAAKEIEYERFSEWVDYYNFKRVKTIHAGFLTLRRRSGHNWVHFERCASEPSLPSGEAILRRFTVRDRPLTDSQILGGKFRIADGVQLRHVVEFGGKEWRVSPRVQMAQTSGLQLLHDLTPEVADFVANLDGRKVFRELVDNLAREAPVPREKVQAECLALLRRLLDRGFVREVE